MGLPRECLGVQALEEVGNLGIGGFFRQNQVKTRGELGWAASPRVGGGSSRSWAPPALREFRDQGGMRERGGSETESTYTSPCVQPSKGSQILGIVTSGCPRAKGPFGSEEGEVSR